jgi:aryl-alcohol dehydrogenase-like predicted oxidoreductase
MMDYRMLSGTDLKMSVITFGTIEFVPAPRRWQRSLEEGKAAMHLALDSGVNVIHTSYEYQTRYAVRQVLRERKDAKSFIHIIKTPDPDTDLTERTFKPIWFRKMVEDALAELNVEKIHVLQWILRDGTECDATKAIPLFRQYKDDLMATFMKLRDEGKVSYLTCFVYNNTFAQEMIASNCFKALLLYYSMLDTTLQPSIDKMREKGMSVLGYRPFCGGQLVTKRANRNAMPAGDRMGGEKSVQRLAKRDDLLAAAGITTDDLTAMAVKFCLASPNVTSLITGMNTPEQVKAVCAAADGKYPDPALGRKLYELSGQLGMRRECNV